MVLSMAVLDGAASSTIPVCIAMLLETHAWRDCTCARRSVGMAEQLGHANFVSSEGLKPFEERLRRVHSSVDLS